MKLTQQQLSRLLKGIGLEDVELVENDAEADFDNDAALSIIDGNRRKVLEPQLKSEIEAEIRPAIEGATHGKWKAALNRVTGVGHKRMEGIDNVDEIARLAVGHKIESVAGTQEETTKRFEEMMKTHNEAIEAKEKEWSGKYEELNNKYVSRDMLDSIKGKLKDAPLPEKLDRDIAAKDLMNYLREKYHLSYDEAAKQVALMDKANPAIPALNEAKNAQIDILAEARSFFEPRNNWMTDMRNVNPADAMANKGQRPVINNQAPTGRTTVEAQRQQRLQQYDKPAV